MKRLIHRLVLLIFSVHTGCFGIPVRESSKGHVLIYDYTGKIETTTTACNDSLARWTVSGDLSLYYQEGYIVAKLDDVKTSLFNGPRRSEHVQEKAIPEESKALLQHFVIKKTKDNNLSILLKPNEPLWSINMKKAIASNLHYDVDIFAEEKDASKKITKPYQEETIYGKCYGEYTMEKFESITTYNKKLTFWNCTDRAIHRETNSLRPLERIDMLDYMDSISENYIVMNNSREAIWKGSSKINITYTIMPNSLYSLNTIQEQTFILRESVKAEDHFDISKLTDERNLIYEFIDEPTSGRHSYETDQSELVKQYLENYDIFQNSFEHPTLENFDVRKDDPVEKMFMILMIMDKQGLKNIEKVTKNTNDIDFINFHYLLLAHIGTNTTVTYLSNFFQSIPYQGYSAQVLRFFAIFPKNIRYPTDDILVGLEPFMDLKNMEEPTVKRAATLSFASAVGRACKKETISKKYIEKYIEIYNNKYLSGKNSEERMTHLLGLINMGECLEAEFMNTLIMNTTEASAFRALAITGFKPYLRVLPNPTFAVYWPIIQNKSEPFDVRVAALDLLLINYPWREQLDIIVDTYSKHFNDPDDKQLANYLLTSLYSLQNTNWYMSNYIGAKATKYVKNNSIPRYPKTWATGYYRLSFTDNNENMGAYFEMRLITDPKTNMVNGMQLTFNNYISSFDFGTYNLYLKIDGLMDWSYALQYINNIKRVSSIPELLKALKENKFQLKEISKNIRCDIILFVDNVAVYAKLIENGDLAEYNSIANEIEDFVTSPAYISYPIMNYAQIPSILGTPIRISTYVQDISKGNFREENLKYRSSWYFQTWMESYNPLADANIASYKYYVDERNLNYKLTVNHNSTLTFTWENKDDYYTQFWDNMMGTAVEEEDVLKQYCQECEPFNELSTDIYSGYTNDFEPFGFEIKVEKFSHKENHAPTLNEFYQNEIHQVNVDVFPFAAPIVLLAHRKAHNFWLNSDLQRGSYRSHPVTGPNTTAQTTLTLNMKSNTEETTNLAIQAEIETKNLADDKIVNYANLSYKHSWMPNTNDEEGNAESSLFQKLKLKRISSHEDSSMKICVDRESFFPVKQSDKFSLKPLSASGKTTIINAKNVEDDEACIPITVHVLSEVYSASNKEKIFEDESMRNDYDKCVSDSKDLKFTSPTAECKRISTRLTNYDDYKVYLKSSMIYYEGGHNVTVDFKQPLIEFSREGKDKLKLAVLKLPLGPPDSEVDYYKHISQYPSTMTINPFRLSYNDDDSPIPRLATSTCIISPSEVEQFSGKYIPNPKKEWLAFAECYNVSTAGLTGHTIDDKHVGFTFYTDEHVVIATVKDGKAELKINGTVQNEFNESFVHFKVHHLSENVYHVTNGLVDIYYNTEYISVKVPSRYSNFVCGICTQDY